MGAASQVLGWIIIVLGTIGSLGLVGYSGADGFLVLLSVWIVGSLLVGFGGITILLERILAELKAKNETTPEA